MTRESDYSAYDFRTRAERIRSARCLSYDAQPKVSHGQNSI
jgi:hypothetical protein